MNRNEVQGVQQGGNIGNLSGIPSQMDTRLSKATEKFAAEIAAAQGGPVVIVQDEKVPQVVGNDGSINQPVPELYDSTVVPAASNYMFYDLSYGPVA